MASLTPTGLETITYGQQGWNAIVTANMQRLNTWLGKLLPLMDSRSRTAGVFSRTKHGADKIAKDLNKQGIPAAAIHGNKSQSARVAALEAAAEEPPSA